MDKVSSREPSHIDETFLATSTDTTYTEEAMLEELAKWKDNMVYESVDHNNQTPISLRWVHSSNNVNVNKKTKARTVAKSYHEENNINPLVPGVH